MNTIADSEAPFLRAIRFLKKRFIFSLFLCLLLNNVLAEEPLGTFQGHTDSVRSVAFLPDGNQALSASSDSTIKLWQLDSGKAIRTFTGHLDKVYAITVSKEGKTLLSGSRDTTLKYWDIQTGETLITFKGHTNSVRAVALSPDGHQALSGSEDNTLKLWNIQTGENVLTFEGHSRSVYAVAFSDDGSQALSGSQDNSVKLWDIKTGETLLTLKDHTRLISAVAFSPNDDHTALSASLDHTIIVWDLEKGQKIKTFKGHSDEVYSVSFYPNGRYALSGSSDNTLKLWEVISGKTLQTFQDHSSRIYAVAISNDGRYAISGSRDNTLKLWKLNLPPTPVISVFPLTSTAPITLSFDASDSLGDITDYNWSVANHQNLIGKEIEFTFEKGGSYPISLTVTDSQNKTQTLKQDFVINQAPTAAFKFSPEEGYAPLTLTLDASSAFDPDGNLTDYQWASSDGQTMSGQQAKITFEKHGNYTLTLSVTDNNDSTSSTEKTITVEKKTPPIARFTLSPTEGKKPLTVHLDGSQSYDPNGHIVRWAWESSNGKTLSGIKTNLILTSVGKQTISLRITDDEGATATAEKTVTVFGTAPVAKFQANPQIGEAPLTVKLNDNNSFDPDSGQITDYVWTSSDGQQAFGETASFIFNNAGSYDVELIVIDNDGEQSEPAHQTVTVKDKSPIAKLTAYPLAGVAPLTVTLEGSHAFDPDGGTLVAYDWKASDEDNTLTTSGETAHLTFKEAGEYTLTLTVTDDEGNLSSDSVTIRVGETVQLVFEGLDSLYSVGDKLKVDLTESIPRRPTEIVDLWLGIQIPSGELMFLTSQPDEPFSLKAQAFKHSVESLEMTHQVLEVEIVPGIGGEYTFYALYVQEGRDPLKAGAEVYRSNLAIKKTTLANQPQM
ncbi:MAG: PKD domain-containing protein [Candidatus Parabeggiatoa sp.]|nr:PKD domain-containing protein [Candidatus Parabeggiatoa sp.]